MKPTKLITNLTLLAGFLAIAPSLTRAGVVIGDQFFAPMNIKATLTYIGENGKYEKMSFNNKDVLAASGYTEPGNILALGSPSAPTNVPSIAVSRAILQSDVIDGDIYVINPKANSVVANLVEQNYADFTYTNYITKPKKLNYGYKMSGRGYFEVYFYDYFGGTLDSLAQPRGEVLSNYNVVKIYGNGLVKAEVSWNNNSKPTVYKSESSYDVKVKLEANDIQAESFDYYYEGGTENHMPGGGSINAAGNGQVSNLMEGAAPAL